MFDWFLCGIAEDADDDIGVFALLVVVLAEVVVVEKSRLGRFRMRL